MNAGELFEKIQEVEKMIKAADGYVDISVECKDDENSGCIKYVRDIIVSRVPEFRLLLANALNGIEYKLKVTNKSIK